MAASSIIEVAWIGNVVLGLAEGDIDVDGVQRIGRAFRSTLQARPLGAWAFLGDTRSHHVGGSLPTPDALRQLRDLVSYCQERGMRDVALVNASDIADVSYGTLYADTGIRYRAFRSYPEAVAWLNELGYALDLQAVLLELPRLKALLRPVG